jgi:hypothetical protein
MNTTGKNKAVYTVAEYLYAHPADIGTTHIFGYGLTKDECLDLQEADFVFHPTLPPAGIRSIDWKQKLFPGEQLRIQGNFMPSSAGPVKLLLSSFHTILDSVTIASAKPTDFELQTMPKQRGRTVYELLAVSGNDTLEKESIPIEVLPADSLKIFFLASSPGFENKFLAGRLAKNGHTVVMRTTISRNKYGYTYLNTSRFSIDQLSPALLDKFDLLIADALALQSLNDAELSVIRNEVAQKGMGLVIKTDSSADKPLFYKKIFPLVYSKEPAQQTKLKIADGHSNGAVLTGQAAYINYQPGTQALVQDQQSHILVSTSLYGSGRLICTTLDNTYRWILAGNEREYDVLWSWCLKKAGRKKTEQETWNIAPALPRIDQPVQLFLAKTDTAIPELKTEENALSLSRDPVLFSQWKGTYWPARAGWQYSQDKKGGQYYWWAYDSRDWKSLYAYQKIDRTREYISTHPYRGRSDRQAKTTGLPLSPIYFYLVFLLSCLWLWVERKL